MFAPKMEIAQEFIYNRRRELKRQIQNKDDTEIPDKVRNEIKAMDKAYDINWKHWADLVRTSISLVNGVIRSDKKRYSNLK